MRRVRDRLGITYHAAFHRFSVTNLQSSTFRRDMHSHDLHNFDPNAVYEVYRRSVFPFLVQLIDESVLILRILSPSPSGTTTHDPAVSHTAVAPPTRKKAHTRRSKDDYHVLCNTVSAPPTIQEYDFCMLTLTKPAMPAQSE